jgi:hypothetical protein
MNNIDSITGKPKIILHLCADIGSDSKPYRDYGYDVICIGKDIGIENYHPPKNVYGIIANPPCTMFSISRGTTAKIPRCLKEGMRLVKECQRIIWECMYDTPLNSFTPYLKFWVIENPLTGMLKYFLGNPTYQYCPSEFGEYYTKKTALWGKFTPPKKPLLVNPIPKGRCLVVDVITKMNCRDDNDRMNARSKCSQKFALAFFEANQ